MFHQNQIFQQSDHSGIIDIMFLTSVLPFPSILNLDPHSPLPLFLAYKHLYIVHIWKSLEELVVRPLKCEKNREEEIS